MGSGEVVEQASRLFISKAVGFFNLANEPAKLSATWSDLGLTGRQHVRDLWRQKQIGTFERRFETTVPRHGVALLRLSPSN